jgi:hypothetical protein
MSAMIASAVVGGFASNKAASTQASAARDAGNLQAQAAREQIASQERMFERQVQLQEPWRQAGINALGQLTSPATQLPAAFSPQTGLPGQFNPRTGMPSEFTGQVDMTRDPGYQFRLSEGLKALDRQAAARGGLISGSALKAAQRFGQDYASGEYGAAYGRALTEYEAQLQRNQLGYGRELQQYGLGVELNQMGYGREMDVYNAAVGRADTSYNRLAGQAGIGQTATGQLASAAGQTGANISNIIGQGAQLQGQAIAAAGQARASGYVGAANSLIGGASNYANYNMQNQFMNRLFPSGGGLSGQVASGASPLYVNDGMGYML